MTAVAKKKYMSKRKRKLIVDIFLYRTDPRRFAMIAPFIWMLSTALKKDQFHIYGRKLFDQLYFSNFIKVFKTIRSWRVSKTASLWRCRRSSSEPSFRAWPLMLAKIKFKFKTTLFLLLLGVTMIPFPVIMIPQYYIFTSLDWIGTLYPLIVPKLFGNIMMIFFLRQYLQNIPDALIESAKMNGQPFPDLLEDYPSLLGRHSPPR